MKKYLKYLFGLFSFGLTLISMQSGFYFYKILFGLSTAILATGVFEILRLATLLYLSLNLETKKKIVAAVLYVMVAFICAFAASSSFHARIIESYQRDLLPYTIIMEGRASVIQQKYAEIYAEKLASIEENIDICRKKTILEPNSTYWPNRLAQLLEDRHVVMMERDSLISSAAQENIGKWVDRHAAITGISFEALPLSRLGAAAITEAVHELWNIGELSVKKLMALAIVLAIEIGIILLAIFARFYAIEASQQKELLSKEAANIANEMPPIGQGQPAKELSMQKSNGRATEPITALAPQAEKISREEAHPELEPPVYSVTHEEELPESEESYNEEAKEPPMAEENSMPDEELQESGESPDVETDPNPDNDIRQSIMDRLQSEFREQDIEAFLNINAPFFKEHGRLVSAGKLNRRLQPIRRTLNKEYTNEDLEKFFEFD
ncbi:MAG: hypothetical protein CV087_21720 [Candidatus Brocadia sp. WS118]|nr:MAG: hypothetical protein CV087_21720 [Candidatus Brocadia sp. WS118]